MLLPESTILFGISCLIAGLARRASRLFKGIVTTVYNSQKGFSLCFRSHQMLIVLLRSRHGFRTVPGDVRELSDLEKLVSIAVRQAGGPVFGSN